MQILISSNQVNLAAALARHPSTVTVEAEFGDLVVEGSILTLAHHGPRVGNPAPCLASNGVGGDPEEIEVIGVSHIDLDTLGGILAVQGIKPEVPGFWELAAFVDINGPHKLAQAGASEENIRRLYAFWAWSQTYRIFAPRDGSVLDVTAEITITKSFISAILADDSDLLAAGDKFRQAEEALNKRSFVQIEAGVMARVAHAFTSHLYITPEGEVVKAVVAFNTITGAVTISLADPIPGVSAKNIVQSLWGPEAGGNDGIAGSPRGQRMTLTDLANAFESTKAAIG